MWRNKRAEEKRIQEFEMEQEKNLEKLQEKIENYNENLSQSMKNLSDVNIKDLSAVTCSKTLHKILQNSKDPDSIMVIIFS